MTHDIFVFAPAQDARVPSVDAPTAAVHCNRPKGLEAPPKIARSRYSAQIRNAKRRGIQWLFTFESWWEVWAASGKWESRGQGSEMYVMARNGDVGPYSPENVEIVTSRQNGRDAKRGVPLGSGRGWTYKPKASKSKPYQAAFRQRYIGSYATEHEARGAYLAALASFSSRADEEDEIAQRHS